MTTAKVIAPNKGYNGKTLGVRFTDGEALVNEVTVPKALGRSPEEVLTQIKKDHPEYQVEETAGNASSFTVPQMPWKKDEAQASEEADAKKKAK
jgi:hypothetical protein